ISCTEDSALCRDPCPFFALPWLLACPSADLVDPVVAQVWCGRALGIEVPMLEKQIETPSPVGPCLHPRPKLYLVRNSNLSYSTGQRFPLGCSPYPAWNPLMPHGLPGPARKPDWIP